MNLFFSDRPGSHERHLRRKVNNPLFGNLQITQEQIQSARDNDEQELKAFMQQFHALAEDAKQLHAGVDASVLVELKQRVEKNYELSCCVMGSMDEIKQALNRLIESIMKALLHASIEDEAAHDQLLQELEGRTRHFGLLEHALIADILRTGSPVRSDELVPSLLSASDKVALAVVQLFDKQELATICEQAHRMLDGVESDHSKIVHARKILILLESARMDVSSDVQNDSNSQVS